MKLRRRARSEAEDTVEKQRVEVRAGGGGRVKALDDSDGAGLDRPGNAEPARLSPQPRRDSGHELPEHGGRERGIEHHPGAKSVRHREHPLPRRD
jgi:hypothetical protein